MNFDSYRQFCLSLPDATEDPQWGALLFRVRRKIFATYDLEPDAENRLTLKCTPERCAELLEREGIERAPYVGRYHWVAVRDFATLPGAELRELVRQSYAMALAKSPRQSRKKRLAVRRKK
jgi:predicted DNA-binding protein (MmcQ/YjbR family)